MSYYKSTSKDNSEEVIRRGKERFEEIRKKVRLEPYYNGYYIVIDVDDGQYVLNEDEGKALAEAEEKFGRKNFFIYKCEFF